MAIHFSILAWRIPWTEEPEGYSPWDHKESDMTEQLIHTHTHKYNLKSSASLSIWQYFSCNLSHEIDIISLMPLFMRRKNILLRCYSRALKLLLFSRQVISDSLWSRGLSPARLLCPWNFPGKNTGVGCHFLLQGIFPTQRLNPHILHWQADSLPLSHQGSLSQS